jgi:GGDEF domain-containing protein
MAANADADRFLAIYLNDHLAGATLGVELARRLRSSNQEDAEFGEPLARLCAEIEGDRQALVHLMERLGVSRDPIKPVLAKAAERLGRLKLNGRIRGYSPLSRVLELEILSGMVGGKMQLWNALEQSFGESLDGFDFHDLAARADSQGQRLEDLHLAAAQRALPAATSGTQGIP